MSCMIKIQSTPTQAPTAGNRCPPRQSNNANRTTPPICPIVVSCFPASCTGTTPSRPGSASCDESGSEDGCRSPKRLPSPVNVQCFPTSTEATPSRPGSADSACDNPDSDDRCGSDNDKSSKATPPIRPSKRLTKPRPPAKSSDKLCCRPKWLKTDSVVRVEYIINYKFPPLPPVSSRYKKWIGKVEPQVDTNLCASKFSSKRENQDKIAALPVPKCPDNCPCHCCSSSSKNKL